MATHKLEMGLLKRTNRKRKKIDYVFFFFLVIRNLIFEQSAPAPASVHSTQHIDHLLLLFGCSFGNEPNGDNHQG